MKNPTEAASILASRANPINLQTALAYPWIAWRPTSPKERTILSLQRGYAVRLLDHARRSLAARKGARKGRITRLMRSPLSLQIAAEIKADIARESFSRSRAAFLGWIHRRAKVVQFPSTFAQAA